MLSSYIIPAARSYTAPSRFQVPQRTPPVSGKAVHTEARIAVPSAETHFPRPVNILPKRGKPASSKYAGPRIKQERPKPTARSKPAPKDPVSDSPRKPPKQARPAKLAQAGQRRKKREQQKAVIVTSPPESRKPEFKQTTLKKKTLRKSSSKPLKEPRKEVQLQFKPKKPESFKLKNAAYEKERQKRLAEEAQRTEYHRQILKQQRTELKTRPKQVKKKQKSATLNEWAFPRADDSFDFIDEYAKKTDQLDLQRNSSKDGVRSRKLPKRQTDAIKNRGKKNPEPKKTSNRKLKTKKQNPKLSAENDWSGSLSHIEEAGLASQTVDIPASIPFISIQNYATKIQALFRGFLTRKRGLIGHSKGTNSKLIMAERHLLNNLYGLRDFTEKTGAQHPTGLACDQAAFVGIKPELSTVEPGFMQKVQLQPFTYSLEEFNKEVKEAPARGVVRPGQSGSLNTGSLAEMILADLINEVVSVLPPASAPRAREHLKDDYSANPRPEMKPKERQVKSQEICADRILDVICREIVILLKAQLLQIHY